MLTLPERCFLAVTETGSFSRAAQRLYISQSSVSKHISQMEKDLGFQLLERTTRSVQLTPQGKIIFDVLQGEIKTWSDALEAARSVDGELSGVLRVGLMHGWSVERLPTCAFERFQQTYPNVELMVEKNTQKAMVERLRSGELDLIIVSVHEIQEYPEIDYCRAFQVPMVVQISSTHPLAKTAKNFDDLNGINAYLLGDEASINSVRFFEEVAHREGLSFNIIPCANHETILTALEQNKGCTLVGEASASVASPRYRCFETGYVMRMICAWNGNAHNKNAEAFVNELICKSQQACTPAVQAGA